MGLKIGNLPLSTIRKIILHKKCKLIRHADGHEKYSRSDLLRPIVIQDHIDPVPAFIVRQIMRTLDITHKDLEKILKEI